MKKIAAIWAALILSAVFILPVFSETAFPENWGILAMGFDLLQQEYSPASGKAEEKILIAVIDSGCDVNHECFSGRLSPMSRNFAGDPDDLTDITGHGTAVTGVLAQTAPPQTEFLILKVMCINEEGEAKFAGDEQFQEAILYALEQGASVINMSIEVGPASEKITDPENCRIWSSSIRKCREQNVPFIAGAGNSASEAAFFYPASDPNIIAVSAIDRFGALQEGSNYGSDILFCGPGEDILVPTAGTTDQYHYSSGTSLAGPYIAAAAAYIRLEHPEFRADEICMELTACCTDLGEPGRDEQYGYGIPVISRYILQKDSDYQLPSAPEAVVLSATLGFENEEAENLFNGIRKKWCVLMGSEVYVEWQLPEAICPAVLHIMTGNDNTSPGCQGRNPADAALYTRNTDDEEWTQIWQQSPEDVMADENYRSYYFRTGVTEDVYCQYRLVIFRTTGSDILQLSLVEVLAD